MEETLALLAKWFDMQWRFMKEFGANEKSPWFVDVICFQN